MTFVELDLAEWTPERGDIVELPNGCGRGRVTSAQNAGQPFAEVRCFSPGTQVLIDDYRRFPPERLTLISRP